jgi:hypothetical protein
MSNFLFSPDYHVDDLLPPHPGTVNNAVYFKPPRPTGSTSVRRAPWG